MKLVKVSGMDEALEKFVKSHKKTAEILCSMIILSEELANETLKTEKERMIVKQDNSIILYEDIQGDKKQMVSFPYAVRPEKLISFFQSMINKSNFEVIKVPDCAVESMKKFIDLRGKRIETQQMTETLNLMLLSMDKGMQNYNEEFEKQIPEIFKFAQQYKPDNAFYHHNNKLFARSESVIVLSNQNFDYIIEKDADTYIINVKNDEKDPMEALDNQFSFNASSDIPEFLTKYRLSFQKLEQPFVLYHFMLDVESVLKAYKKENSIEDPVNPVVKSYEYCLAHWSRQHNVTKEEALWRMAFYTFPKGVDEQGNYLFSDEVLPYSKISESLMTNIHETIGHKQFTVPVILDRKALKKSFKSYTYVNESWQGFFKDLHEALEGFIEKYKKANEEERAELTLMEEANKESEEFIEDLEFYSSMSKKLSVPSASQKAKKVKM